VEGDHAAVRIAQRPPCRFALSVRARARRVRDAKPLGEVDDAAPAAAHVAVPDGFLAMPSGARVRVAVLVLCRFGTRERHLAARQQLRVPALHLGVDAVN
jgi:hypothetical protein